MESDTLRMRVNLALCFHESKGSGGGVEQIATFIVENGINSSRLPSRPIKASFRHGRWQQAITDLRLIICNVFVRPVGRHSKEVQGGGEENNGQQGNWFRRGRNPAISSLRPILLVECRGKSPAISAVALDVFALYVKTKNFHWHMSGRHFRDYHHNSQRIDDKFCYGDDIAERARSLGETPAFHLEISKHQRLKDDNRESVLPEHAGGTCTDNQELTFLAHVTPDLRRTQRCPCQLNQAGSTMLNDARFLSKRYAMLTANAHAAALSLDREKCNGYRLGAFQVDATDRCKNRRGSTSLRHRFVCQDQSSHTRLRRWEFDQRRHRCFAAMGLEIVSRYTRPSPLDLLRTRWSKLRHIECFLVRCLPSAKLMLLATSRRIRIVTTLQIFLWKISWTSRRGSRSKLTTRSHPNTEALHDFLSPSLFDERQMGARHHTDGRG